MNPQTLSDIAGRLRGVDTALLATRTLDGETALRPMSNGCAEYEGDSYYFTHEDSITVKEIEQDDRVSLSFSCKPRQADRNHFYAAIEGRAELIRDKDAFRRRWSPDLDFRFPLGVDTPGLVLIHVHANRLKYWDGAESGEIACH
jgi:general stress protein 26